MAIKAEKKGDSLDLEMNGVVGDGWAENPITSKGIAKVLRDNADAKLIRVALNSPGGYVVEGLQIYQALADHPATVIVSVGAQAASCGSLIAMAGDEIILHETSLFLVHNPWNFTIGDYQDHERAAAELRMMADVFATAYAKRTGKSKADIQALMDEDRYMDAAEAKAFGFCDRIIESKKKVKEDKEKALTPEMARAILLDSRSQAVNRARRATAAAFTTIETNNPPAPNAPEAASTKEDTMNLVLLVAALGLTEGANEADAIGEINKLKASKGETAKLLGSIGAKSTEDAIGRIEALKSADERAKAAETELANVHEANRKEKHSALVAAALDPKSGSPHAGKLTPAQKAWAESVTTETLEGFLAVAPPVLKGDGLRAPVNNASSAKTKGGSALTWNGKTYAEMTNLEKHGLSKSDPELFAQMSDEFEASNA